MAKLVRQKRRAPNKYLSAFLFGNGEVSPEVYTHFARRFTYFKEQKSPYFFNWHAWLVAPFYYCYRGLYGVAFMQLVLFTALVNVALSGASIALAIGCLGVWLVVTHAAAYKSDYGVYQLYLKKIGQYDVKNSGDEGLKQLTNYGGGHYGAVVIYAIIAVAIIWMVQYYFSSNLAGVIQQVTLIVSQGLVALHEKWLALVNMF